jgi:hypothetical protein
MLAAASVVAVEAGRNVHDTSWHIVKGDGSSHVTSATSGGAVFAIPMVAFDESAQLQHQ